MRVAALATRLLPPLNGTSHKGQHGCIAVLGGCMEYCGAPYYAGISTLKTGADLCHIFCGADAGIPIKAYVGRSNGWSAVLATD
jgi:ATP-dependent NAD(P)H-hydrate dehydratase